MGLRARLLRAVLTDLPEPTSVLTEPAARWDELLGGRTGPDSWKHYGRGYGTTCAVALDGWLISAGAPPELIDADPPAGSGFKIGESVSRLNEGAKSLGWVRLPVRGELPAIRPGDVYQVYNQTASGPEVHVGVVLRVTPIADGLEVETADGGQGTRQQQSATRNVRIFRTSTGPHAVTVQSPASSGWLDRWFAIGGDEPDEVEPSDTPVQADRTALVVGGVIAGVAFMLAGLALHTTPRGINSIRRQDHVYRELALREQLKQFGG